MNEQKDRANRRQVGGYLAPILVILFTIFWVLTSYWLIGERSRDWQYGTTPYVPAQSHFTTQKPPPGPVPKQVELPVRKSPKSKVPSRK